MRALAFVLAALFAGTAAAEEPPRIRAAYVADGVPVRPDAAAWSAAAELKLALLPQMMLPPHGGGSVTQVSVRAIHNAQQLGLRFEWEDATADREVGVSTFRDALAVGFPTRHSELLPSPFMGDAEHSLNIWQWTADFDANARGQGGFADRYPHTEGVWYFPQDYDVSRDVRGWRGTEPVIELTAAGFGTLERKVSQNVLGLAAHDKGRWGVVLRRQLSTGNPGDTLFRAGETTHLIVAIWNGSSGEVNGKKAVTMMWTPLELESTVVAEK